MDADRHSEVPPRRTMVRSRLAAWASVVWAGLIFAASSVPGSAVPGRFGDSAHVVEYAVLGILLVLARLDGGLAASVVIATAVASAWGATDELHQAFVPLRVPDAADWLRDTFGALGGATAAGLALRLRAVRFGRA